VHGEPPSSTSAVRHIDVSDLVDQSLRLETLALRLFQLHKPTQDVQKLLSQPMREDLTAAILPPSLRNREMSSGICTCDRIRVREQD
jgi:hypothetical protein